MWKHIASEDELLLLIKDASSQKPIVLFKHSTRCPVSFTAKKMFEMQWSNSVDTYLIDLIAYRNQSDLIAKELNVEHESPQVLLIHKGECIYHASHHSIDGEAVQKTIQDI